MRRVRWLAMVPAVVAVGLFGHGHWAEDACSTAAQASRLPEGALGRQAALWWPPGALRCRWHLPNGERVAYTVTPW